MSKSMTVTATLDGNEVGRETAAHPIDGHSTAEQMRRDHGADAVIEMRRDAPVIGKPELLRFDGGDPPWTVVQIHNGTTATAPARPEGGDGNPVKVGNGPDGGAVVAEAAPQPDAATQPPQDAERESDPVTGGVPGPAPQAAELMPVRESGADNNNGHNGA